jgi:hypothetical protein
MEICSGKVVVVAGRRDIRLSALTWIRLSSENSLVGLPPPLSIHVCGTYRRIHLTMFVVELVTRHFVGDIVPPMLIDESTSARTSILCPEPCFHPPSSQTAPLHLHEDRREAAARDRLRQANMLFRRRLQSRKCKCSRKPGQGVVARRPRLSWPPRTLHKPPLTQLWATTLACIYSRVWIHQTKDISRGVADQPTFSSRGPVSTSRIRAIIA